MYVCTYVRMYVCTYVRMYVCTYVRMYVCTYVRMYVCTYVRMYVCTYVRMYVCTYVRMYVCTYVRMYVCTYVRMYVCTFYWSGRPQEHPRTEGVGFALSKRVIDLLIGSPTAISSRVMSIRLKATKHRNITVLSAYAPTFKSDASSKDAFFQDLQKAIDDTS